MKLVLLVGASLVTALFLAAPSVGQDGPCANTPQNHCTPPCNDPNNGCVPDACEDLAFSDPLPDPCALRP